MTITQETKAIMTIMTQHSDGIGIAELEKALTRKLKKTISRRTLQRRLDQLIQERQIVAIGESVARLYKPIYQYPEILPMAACSIAEAEPKPDTIYTSTEGTVIRNYVKQAVMHRRPIAYQRSFLENYEPGVTWYLPESLRLSLHQMGRTPEENHPAGTYARDILSRLLIDLSWASSRLEGNTYSRLDTKNLIEFGEIAQGKDAEETQMILNHKAAIEMLVENIDEVGFNPFTFQNLHALLSKDLMHDDAASGRLRQRPVEISGSVFYPLAIPPVLEDCFRLLLAKADAIPDPFEQAFFLMVQLPYLQPFEDVNKRTSRIGANLPLIKHNLCPLSFVDVPEAAYVEGTLGVYELNQVELLRDVFLWSYERSCQRYLAIKQILATPNPLKIKYHNILITAVQEVVNDKRTPTTIKIQQLANALVPQEEVETFSRFLTEAITQLHEGNIMRYRLKRSEFLDWKAAVDIKQ
jgi:hypothetical protein